MPQREFVISDLHLGHSNILTFKNKDGSPLRDFKSLDEMHSHIASCWNKVVGLHDKVYVLGDVIMNKKNGAFGLLAGLNGKKSLVRGNHDIFELDEYLKYFYDVQGVKVKPKLGLVMTHVPVHPDCLNRPSWRVNVHGHLHGNNIEDKSKKWSVKFIKSGLSDLTEFYEPDPKYFNVSVEQLNYTPMDLEEVYEKTKHVNVQEKDTKEPL